MLGSDELSGSCFAGSAASVMTAEFVAVSVAGSVSTSGAPAQAARIIGNVAVIARCRMGGLSILFFAVLFKKLQFAYSKI
jgi:hypothetical protein